MTQRSKKINCSVKRIQSVEKKGASDFAFGQQASLLKMQSLAPETELGILYWNRDEVEIAQAELNEIKDCVSHVVVNQHVLTKADIQKVKEAGFSVHVYTVNDVEMAEKLKTWGADGIITDFPDLLHFF